MKKLEYQGVPTIRRYILIEYLKVAVTVHSRSGEGTWEGSARLAAGDLMELPEIGIAIPVDELYERVSFAAG